MENINRKEIAGIVSKLQYMAAKDLLDDLNASGVNYAIVKGCPLAYYKTGDPASRLSGDIDLMISRQNLGRVVSILEKNGFQSPYALNREERIMMVASSHQILAYYKDWGSLRVEVDVNFDLFWGEYRGKRIDVNEFLKDFAWIDIFGCKVKALPPLKALIQLILHHYKEMNSLFYLSGACAIKRRFFEDIYLLCKRYPEEITVKDLYYICSTYGIVPYVYYMFYYTRKVYNDQLLDVFVEAFCTKDGEKLIDCYGLTEQERKEWKIPFEERLDANVSESIYNEMTVDDMEKLALSRKLFVAD